MFEKLLAAVIAVIVGLTSMLSVSRGKRKKAEEKAKLEEAKAVIREKQMETVNEVRKELNLIQKETPPEEVIAPSPGDSTSRLDRLNRLHNN